MIFDKFVIKVHKFLHRRAAIGFATPLVKHFETYAPRPYVCEGGKLTIGYGHVMQQGDPRYVTEKEASRWLSQELRNCYLPSAISALDTRDIYVYSYPTYFLGALTSAVYNLGPRVITKGSWFDLWRQGKYDEAAERFYLWNKASGKTQPGLVRRRMSEWQLLMTGRWEYEPRGWKEKYEELK